MKAMIFAAGLGTRFKPWTDKHPKALALVNGKPLLQHAIQYLQHYNINEVVVNVHHFADQVIDAIKNNGWGSEITISNEKGEVLETGGGLLKAKHLLQDQRFITINVDILTDLNIDKFIDYHQQTGSFISLAIAERKTSRFFYLMNRTVCVAGGTLKAKKSLKKLQCRPPLMYKKHIPAWPFLNLPFLNI